MNKPLLRHIKKLLIQYRWKYITGAFFLLLTDIFQLISPRLIGWGVDYLNKGSLTFKSLLLVFSSLLLLAILTAIFRFFWRIQILATARKLEAQIREKYFTHLQTLSLNFFNYKKTGELMALATNDLGAVREMFAFGVVMLLDTIFLGTLSIFFLLSISPKLTLYIAIPLPLITLTIAFFGKITHKRFKLVQDSFAKLTDKAEETIAGIRVVKAYVQEEAELKKFIEKAQDLLSKNIHLVKAWGFMFPTIELLANLSILLVFLLGGLEVIKGNISLGDFIAFNSYLGLLIWPMNALGWVVNNFQRGRASLERINEVLDEIPDIKDSPKSIKKETLEGYITFKNVYFKYPSSPKWILEDISIEIKPGKFLGITGPVGSGKTSLVSLIPRLFNIQKGEIFIDNIPIKDLSLHYLRKNIGFVPQDSFLFSDTIANNIRFGKPDLSDDEIYKLIKIVALEEDLKEFPNGIHTIVGERGVTLSGGQKQRVAIARALAINPPVLIFDDALSAVDAKTERQILENLLEIRKNKSLIVIAQRLSVIQDADEIIVLKEGKIIERGDHNKLMRLGGFYAELFEQQKIESELERREDERIL
ncbi:MULTISPECIES: ABC transporter ATP-binding protein [Dictyoglomus]|uniref:ABC transporter related n=1 Tax=Dictyoglomus turgidum (strain DSM 6724 / Z-1310) TaxID=515635 RepID=B8DZM6_DICTD|nr:MULTISPECIES: ABC transporter ATP-binding protein [Dictyoglomus]ACK41959.1 ABC transporter related [Dictyoglomus turgidum DSM 6724]HBU31481.1 ABC transporter ATP-binding protein [Dictyoglomus sp.]